ncbi:MAG: thrombospondin type 3 repeat-containing protein [candidate division Zixibacteria bacterium]|nr:thrombospondin type 3 repeat-containing protein [candidate division Zixibacteria bacterium]
MKRYALAVFAVAAVFVSLPINAQLLHEPESVVFDSLRNRYLVSNAFDGAIVQIDSNGVQSYFANELEKALGMHIVADTLYVSSTGGALAGLVGYSLVTGERVRHVPLTGMLLLNDIASDTSGYLYVTESENNRMFRISLTDYSYTTIGQGVLAYPNGLCFDDVNNRMLVSDYSFRRPIYALNLQTFLLTVVVYTDLGIDGITRDHEGNYYGSHWETGGVYKWEPTFAEPKQQVIGGQNDPADIFFNLHDTVMAVPNFSGNVVRLIPWWNWQDFDDDGRMNGVDNCPNHANPAQEDSDGDTFGDSCDVCPGYDDRVDTDGDGTADGCDTCTDTDGDGFGNPGYGSNTCDPDNCPDIANPGQEDGNGDGYGDVCCCHDGTGNVDGDVADGVDVGDLTKLIQFLFIDFEEPYCLAEANTDGAGGVDVGDLTGLIDYLFISFEELAECL